MIAFQNASELGGSRGADLAAAAESAFVSGLRSAVLIAAVLLALAGLYTWWRGPSLSSVATDAETDDDEAMTAQAVALQPCWGSGAGTVVVKELSPAPQ